LRARKKRTAFWISVKKAKSHNDGSTLGVLEVGSPKRYTFNRVILARLETGGDVRQLQSKKADYRKQMLTKGTKQQGKRLPRMVGKTGPSSKYKDKRRAMASSLKMARRRGMKYASTPYGLYRITKRKAYKIAGYRKDKKIKTPKKPNNISASSRLRTFSLLPQIKTSLTKIKSTTAAINERGISNEMVFR